MFKTRIKRTEFIFNIMVLALLAIAASTQLLSAYGAICSVWDFPSPGPPGSTFGNATTTAFWFIYQPSNIITWIVAFAYGFLIYSYLTKMPWFRFFIISIIVTGVGFITGLLPALLSDTAGFTEEFDFGSPNWGRTIGNLIVIITLLLMQFVPRLRTAAKNFVEASDVAGRYVKQLIYMSLFFFWLAATSFLGTEFMRGAHVVDGVNVWQTVDFQMLGGVITSIIGASMLSTALIYSQIRPSSALITAK